MAAGQVLELPDRLRWAMNMDQGGSSTVLGDRMPAKMVLRLTGTLKKKEKEEM
jgi:hypothetical protein